MRNRNVISKSRFFLSDRQPLPYDVIVHPTKTEMLPARAARPLLGSTFARHNGIFSVCLRRLKN
jgi:hypothetical protein